MWLDVSRGLRTALSIAAVGVALATMGSAAMAAPIALTSLMAPVEGVWKTQDGTEITVAPCADGFCGSLSWFVVPSQYKDICNQDKASFAPQMTDLKNPDAAQRSRPILGLQMMTIKPTGDPTSYSARIYNPQDGSSNDISVWILADNTMRIGGGCVGSMCVVTQDWPKVPARAVTPDFSCDGQ